MAAGGHGENAMASTVYNDNFFHYHEEESRRSARLSVPAVLEFIQPGSVVDVGCGNGTWLAEFFAAGVRDYLGLDGDYVNRSLLLIEPERFLPRDLAQPFSLERTFDLAVSVEVAEHLAETSAAGYVGSLVRLAPVILFSAAIPGQLGDDHINLQWPEYWQQLFAVHNYQAVDCLRMRLWKNDEISVWYRQNLLFYVDRARLSEFPKLAAAAEAQLPDQPLGLVHPEHYWGMHKYLLDQLEEARCAIMRGSFNLRELTVLAFPDSTEPEPAFRAQVSALTAAFWTHPQRQRISLVICHSEGRESWAQAIFKEVLASVRGSEPPVGDELHIAAVNTNFPSDQWPILLACSRARVALPSDDAASIARAGAAGLSVVTLSAIENKQLLPTAK
jgi:SAM-dependent methyltransferase